MPSIAYIPWLFLLLVRTFLKMAGGDSEFVKLTVPALKALLKAHSQTVSGQSKNLLLMPQDANFFSFFFSFALVIF